MHQNSKQTPHSTMVACSRCIALANEKRCHDHLCFDSNQSMQQHPLRVMLQHYLPSCNCQHMPEAPYHATRLIIPSLPNKVHMSTSSFCRSPRLTRILPRELSPKTPSRAFWQSCLLTPFLISSFTHGQVSIQAQSYPIHST